MTPETQERLLNDVGEIKANVKHLLERGVDHNKRLGSLERRRWMEQGAIGVLAAVIVPKVRAIFGI